MVRFDLIVVLTLCTLEFLPNGCRAVPAPPNKPFVVVWNHPSQGCGTNYLPFQDYNIVDNNRDRFIGEKIVTFYNLGAWPRLNNDGSMFNGGIPQLANLTLHFDKVRSRLDQITSPDFSGIGSIDMESWRPIYETDYTSYRKYQAESLKYVDERFPGLSQKQRWAKAVEEWNTAARKMMEDTLKLVTKLRPNGKWGYYGYPRPWSPGNTVRINDAQSYIWNITSGLYPSIYFVASQLSHERRQGIIQNNLKEALRVKDKFCHRDTPIMPYTFSQNGPYIFFNESELEDAIGLPAEMGTSGVVIWGASGYMHRPNACNALKAHVMDTLGPYVLRLTNFFGNCSEQLCHANGRCVRKDFVSLHRQGRGPSDISAFEVSSSSESLPRRDPGSPVRPSLVKTETAKRGPQSERAASVGYNFDDYSCVCYSGSVGRRCDQKT